MTCLKRRRPAVREHGGRARLHTALLHQCGWFVQWKEGPGEPLRELMARVANDPRHHSMRIVHASRGRRLLHGPWSMAIVQCADTPQETAGRVARLRRQVEEGRQSSPPAAWRQLSTPLRHPGAARQADPDAFQRVLVCSARGMLAFELVRWLAHRTGHEVVHRRLAGAQDLDVGTDYVDFPRGGRMLRVIAMARRGLSLPLTRAFLPDYSHVLVLLSGDAQADLGLVRRVAHACTHLAAPPLLLGVAPLPQVHVPLAGRFSPQDYEVFANDFGWPCRPTSSSSSTTGRGPSSTQAATTPTTSCSSRWAASSRPRA